MPKNQKKSEVSTGSQHQKQNVQHRPYWKVFKLKFLCIILFFKIALTRRFFKLKCLCILFFRQEKSRVPEIVFSQNLVWRRTGRGRFERLKYFDLLEKQRKFPQKILLLLEDNFSSLEENIFQTNF